MTYDDDFTEPAAGFVDTEDDTAAEEGAVSARELSSVEIDSLTSEILTDVLEYAHTQSEMSDEELKGIVDDYLYEKIDRGELDEGVATDEIRKKVLAEWARRQDEGDYAYDEDEF